MSKSLPTPGPWKLVPATEHHGPYITSPWGITLCDLYTMSNPLALSTACGGTSRPIPFVDADANAQLISAAPDLLDALKAMVDRWEPDCGGLDRLMWENARDAIAKAGGTST